MLKHRLDKVVTETYLSMRNFELDYHFGILQMQHTYGERTTGLVFRVECNAQQMSKQSIWNKLKLYDPISLVKFMWTDRTIKNYDIDVYFDGQRSSTNSVTVSTKWGKFNSLFYNGTLQIVK